MRLFHDMNNDHILTLNLICLQQLILAVAPNLLSNSSLGWSGWAKDVLVFLGKRVDLLTNASPEASSCHLLLILPATDDTTGRVTVGDSQTGGGINVD